jgi:glycosyltransferase involved in cell wall biosynthesis
MIATNKVFDNVTLLITHFNRSKSLERLLDQFEYLGCSFKEIIVSDDCSRAEHLDYIQSLHTRYSFTLLTSPVNRGLGNNINKGQDAVKTEFTLYVQEDFVPLDFEDGLGIIQSDDDVDSVRFYSYLNYPNLKAFKKGFSEMIFDPWSFDLDKVPMYSDHPHLRRSNFFDKFGRYSETKSSDQTEYDMMISFLKKKTKAYLYADYKSLFEPINSTDEPSMVARNYWRNTNNVFISTARKLYRHLKFNYRYYFSN